MDIIRKLVHYGPKGPLCRRSMHIAALRPSSYCVMRHMAPIIINSIQTRHIAGTPKSLGVADAKVFKRDKPHSDVAPIGHKSEIMEFFDDPKNYGETSVKSGRPWSMSDLRIKSNSDLHKLWFVLYKERNMLYTMQEAARDECELFPSPERIDKVEESMANLENVVRERNDAYWKLEVSACASGERPRVFRRDVFGRHRFINCSQHIVPYSRNSIFRTKFGPGNPDETDWFFGRYREMKRREYNKYRSKVARGIRHLLRRFPDADVDYIQELHPEFPPGYIRHLQENIHLYDDRPTRATSSNVKKHCKELGRSQEERLLD